jgi:hypothetical protein
MNSDSVGARALWRAQFRLIFPIRHDVLCAVI